MDVKGVISERRDNEKPTKKELAIDKLVPEDILEEMSPAEMRGLGWLSQILEESSMCRVDDKHNIVVDFNGEAELVFDIPATIKCHWNSINMEDQPPALAISVRAIPSFTVFGGPSAPNEGRVCVNSMTSGMPITDHCASFVLWAEHGFYQMPRTIRESLDRARGYTQQFVRDLYSYAFSEVSRMRWREMFSFCESFPVAPGKLTLDRAKLDIATIMADPEKRGLLEADSKEIDWDLIYSGDYYESRGGT